MDTPVPFEPRSQVTLGPWLYLDGRLYENCMVLLTYAQIEMLPRDEWIVLNPDPNLWWNYVELVYASKR